MPGYLVDEGGERTHAVLPVDEYERLKKAEGRLESVRGYAMEMISAMGAEEKAEEKAGARTEEKAEAHNEAHGEAAHAEAREETNSDHGEAGEEQDRAWYQRT